ncbi:glycoside hydrolase family 88 protein [Arsenicibacter rosenii]|uniref:Glucuronyl hydrolase n=1 Tax=Arsenicibacter rosenii TaxID=1750698 RepID=A0A1S2VK91_9BACT|nr:glycoside hydrolase family 88 protein [Arsenicibacter rosenii]OIN58238.1 glucuronyl hydrolase [Arsenicibacter rosenii]
MKTYTLTLLALMGLSGNGLCQKALIKSQFDLAGKQARVMLADIPAATPANARVVPVSPRTLNPTGALQLVPARDWTSGFFPGQLWYLYEYTHDPEWMKQARTYTAKIENEKLNAGTHDMGFKIYCSFGNGYRLTNDPAYRDVIIQSARTLIKRYKPAAGIIRSWDHHKEVWQCPVIIDNMMNLELLFAATRLTGDKTFADIAVKHAQTTMKNHFRPDMSSYHVVDYDTLTGKVIQKNTHQGYSHESAWARGQAWALYGYTMCYRETRDKAFLEQADKIAAYMLRHPRLPADLIPYWDFDAPQIPNEPRDVSAATVMASALYELSTFSKQGAWYRSKADRILDNLAKHYVSPAGGSHGFILLHSTGSKPANSEVDVPLSYADYYYLEALLRKQKLEIK